MRINNIQRGEIVTTSRKPAFQSKTTQTAKTVKTVEPLLPQSIIDHFGLNMDAAVKRTGEPSYTPAPLSVGEKLSKFFHNLQVDWSTHVDPNKPKSRF